MSRFFGLSHVGYNADALYADLKSSLGSSLIGLYVGEDIVTDSSGAVTNWRGRVGPILTNNGGIAYTQLSSINSRYSTNNTTSTGVGLTATMPSAIKSVTCVLNIPSMPWTRTNYVCAGAVAENILLGDTTDNTNWRTNTGFTHYNNGVKTETVVVGNGIYEGIDATCTQTDLRLCGLGSSYPTLDFIGKIAFCMVLSAVPTTLQRLQVTYYLAKYYSLPIEPQAKLALDLYNVFGSSIIDVWIGEDLVFSGANVVSWSGRVNSTTLLSSGSAGSAVASTLNGHTALRMATNAANVSNASIAATKSHWVVSNSQPVVAAWCRFGDTYPVDGIDSQFSTHGNDMYRLYEGGWNHFVNGVDTYTLPAGDTKFVASADQSGNARTGLAITATATATVWGQPIPFVMALNAVPSTDQRTSGIKILRNYYKF